MKFFADGPIIPDLLLERCDQGRVVFLCGAGVSFPSGMPDFVGLTKHVVAIFDPPKDSAIATSFTPWVDDDYDGPLVPLDQIFHLLYQDYGREEVNALVARRLSQDASSESSYEHSLIARISSDPEGRPQIVTTNFDHLFDNCPNITPDRLFEPPAFPDIALGMPIHGVIYLHGRLRKLDSPNHDYILSSADFGRAYLAEGWATKFVKALLDTYTVVLVGYQADDPPIKYLLQGLNHDGRRDLTNLYAFDKGALEDIEVKWRDRGVSPIAYNEHPDLWKTLDAWANRADDPRAWRNGVVEMARKGPRTLSPHERGQVAHLVKTTPGARLFAQSEPSPPAEWLCALDASCRAAEISKSYDEGAKEFDPLEIYGLDDDPERASEEEPRTARSYDHFLEWRRGDTNPTTGHSLAGWQMDREDLPSRLNHLLNWSAKHLNSPILAWWATRQHRLHPRLQNEMERQMKVMKDLHPKARRCWNLILEMLAEKRRDSRSNGWYDLKGEITKNGWTNGVLRKLNVALGPILTCEPLYGLGASKPPEGTWDEASMQDVARWEVKFPERFGEEFNTPDDVLPEIFQIAQGHLRRAVSLHNDIETSYYKTPTCYPGRQADGEDRDRDTDAYFRWFLTLMNRMAEQHSDTLRSHVLTWSHRDQFFFRKLKLFAMNDPRIFAANQAAGVVLGFGPDELWDTGVLRELLFLLEDRWQGFMEENRVAIVDRLLAGPQKRDYQSDEEYPRIRDEFAARYTRYLELQGCRLTEGQSNQLAKLVSNIPDWSDGWAASIVVEHGMHIGWVGTDDDPRSLSNVPVGKVVERAMAESRTDYTSHTDIMPFNGLVTADPRKALAALSHTGRQGEYPENLWRALIQGWPKGLPTRLNQVFLKRLARLPQETMRALSHPLADRMKADLKRLYENDPEFAWFLFVAFVSGLISDAGSAINSGIGETRIGSKIINSSRRTYGHAINGPIGRLADGLIDLLNSLKLEQNSGLPYDFQTRIERLLAAPGEGRDHAVAILVSQLSWLYFLDPDWVKERIMPWFSFDHPASEPTWNAYLSSAKLPQKEIGELLNPLLLEIFPRIYQWNWDRNLAKVAAQMIIELKIFRQGSPDGLTVNEARQCIRNMSDANRRDAIFHLGRIGIREQEGWANHVVPFIDKTWPRERKFRTTEMVSAWVSLLDDTGDDFPLVLKNVRRFLIPVENKSHQLYQFSREVGGKVPLTAKYPADVLDMLDAIVPNDPQSAPNELGGIIDLIEESDPGLASDRRFYRLIDLVENR